MRSAPPVPRTSALADLHERFLFEQRFSGRRSPATLRSYRQAFAVLASLLPTLTPSQLTPAAMTEFFRRLETRSRIVGRGQERRGVKASTIATYRSKLRQFFLWLRGQGKTAVDPFEGLP